MSEIVTHHGLHNADRVMYLDQGLKQAGKKPAAGLLIDPATARLMVHLNAAG